MAAITNAIIFTPPTARGVPTIMTLQTANIETYVTTTLSEAYYGNKANWDKVIVFYRSTTSSQREYVVFNADGIDNPTANFDVSSMSLGDFLIEYIAIRDRDGGVFHVEKGNLTTAEFNVILDIANFSSYSLEFGKYHNLLTPVPQGGSSPWGAECWVKLLASKTVATGGFTLQNDNSSFYTNESYTIGGTTISEPADFTIGGATGTTDIAIILRDAINATAEPVTASINPYSSNIIEIVSDVAGVAGDSIILSTTSGQLIRSQPTLTRSTSLLSSGPGNNTFMTIGINADNKVVLQNGSDESDTATVSATTLALNQWYYIHMGGSPSTPCKVYINGVVDANMTSLSPKNSSQGVLGSTRYNSPQMLAAQYNTWRGVERSPDGIAFSYSKGYVIDPLLSFAPDETLATPEVALQYSYRLGDSPEEAYFQEPPAVYTTSLSTARVDEWTYLGVDKIKIFWPTGPVSLELVGTVASLMPYTHTDGWTYHIIEEQFSVPGTDPGAQDGQPTNKYSINRYTDGYTVPVESTYQTTTTYPVVDGHEAVFLSADPKYYVLDSPS